MTHLVFLLDTYSHRVWCVSEGGTLLFWHLSHPISLQYNPFYFIYLLFVRWDIRVMAYFIRFLWLSVTDIQSTNSIRNTNFIRDHYMSGISLESLFDCWQSKSTTEVWMFPSQNIEFTKCDKYCFHVYRLEMIQWHWCNCHCHHHTLYLLIFIDLIYL